MDDISVHRAALLERIRRVNPRILAVVAPAGFGKSMLVRQYAAEHGGARFCDCGGVRDDLDLARRLFPDLVALTDGGATVAERLGTALDAWTSNAVPVVFERAEYLARAPAALGFFSRLLERRPPGCVLAICSRDPLRVQLSRYAPPHEVLTLRAGDLIFDRDDVRAIFKPFICDDRAVERIARVSGGWPVAVFLLRRFASEGRLDRLLDRLDELAFDELREYFAAEVLATLDARVVEAIFACAAIPRATAKDLRLALDDPAIVDDFDELIRDGAFFERDAAGAYTLHPMVASLMLGSARERRDALLARVARAHEERGDLLRAAELYLERGDRQSAARALNAIEIDAEPDDPQPYLRALAELDSTMLARYPRLWAASALARLFRVDGVALLDESEALWRTIATDEQAEYFYVAAVRALLMSHYGRSDEALAQIERFMPLLNEPQQRGPFEGHLRYLRGMLRARRGAFDEGERDLRAALLPTKREFVLAAIYTALGAEVARPRGEWALERQFLARAYDHATASMMPNYEAFVVAEMLVAAWLSGDDAGFARYADELEERVTSASLSGLAYLAGVARGRAIEPQATDAPRFRIFAHLVAISRVRHDGERAGHARVALRLAAQVQSPFLETLAAVALALVDPPSFLEAMVRARAAAAACESPALSQSVEAVAAELESVGILTHFVQHVTRDRSVAAPIAVEILAGRVRVDGAPVRVSVREFELLAAIALRRDATPRSRLAGLLWPDVGEEAARNALSVCLHRLRTHLGRDDAIARVDDGYRLHSDAFVDCWELERATEVLRATGDLRESERVVLIRAWERLREERASMTDRWEWFEPVASRLDDLHTAVAQRLASDALVRGDAASALTFAESVIVRDPCDERAREAAMRAYLAIGDRAAALRSFRQYRTALREELDVEPSPAIAALVNAGA
jgi:DNA-binding SARP family transcriptional activator